MNFLESKFVGVNRLFVLVCPNRINDSKRFKTQNYYIQKACKTCKYLNYVEYLLILVSTVTGCVSVSVFASLVFCSCGCYEFCSRNKYL